MPTITQSIDLDYSIETLWSIVYPFENWITQIPGYITHEVLNENEFYITFKLNYGMVKKTVKLNLKIKKLIKPSIIEFEFISESKHLQGQGFFQTKKNHPTSTNIYCSLDITAKGAMAPIIHSKIKNASLEKSKVETVNMVNKMVKNHLNNYVKTNHK